MTILLVDPGKPPRKTELPNDLRAMQDIVGGYIQAVYPFEEPVALVCNDEGKLLNLPPNRPLFVQETNQIYDVVCGTFFLCAAPPDSENFESLTDEQIARYTALFSGGGCFV